MQYFSYPDDTIVFAGADELGRGYTARVEAWRNVLIGEWKRTRKTLDDLAESSTLNRGTVHRILDKTTADPGINTIEKLAKAFDFSMIDLYTRAATITPSRKVGDDGAETESNSDPRLAHRIGESFKGVFSAIDAVPLSERGKFINAVVAVLTSMEHALAPSSDREAADGRRK